MAVSRHLVRVARLVCICTVGADRGGHQCLRWWQQYATGILRFDLSSLAFKRKMQGWHQAIPAFLVRVARLELAASWSQTRRPTNWATPGSHPSGMPRGQYQDIISDIYGKCKQNMLHISGGGELRQTRTYGGKSKTTGGAAHIS